MYQIKKYSFDQAEKMGVIIKPSIHKNKKIDVFDKKTNKFITSIGNLKYKDFPTYLLIDKKLAEERRRLYKIRHAKDKDILNSRGYYADKIL
jgi:hypothetical protein